MQTNSAMRNLSGNERYEGFCVDLIREIAQRVGFNYTIRLAPEAKYGISDPITGEWNGIVRELMDRVEYQTLSTIFLLVQLCRILPFFFKLNLNFYVCLLFTDRKPIWPLAV